MCLALATARAPRPSDARPRHPDARSCPRPSDDCSLRGSTGTCGTRDHHSDHRRGHPGQTTRRIAGRPCRPGGTTCTSRRPASSGGAHRATRVLRHAPSRSRRRNPTGRCRGWAGRGIDLSHRRRRGADAVARRHCGREAAARCGRGASSPPPSRGQSMRPGGVGGCKRPGGQEEEHEHRHTQEPLRRRRAQHAPAPARAAGVAEGLHGAPRRLTARSGTVTLPKSCWQNSAPEPFVVWT